MTKYVILSFVGIILCTILIGIVNSIICAENQSGSNDKMNDIMQEENKILYFLSSVIFAPISEEMIYRGVMYGCLRTILKKRGGIILSIFLTGAIFGFSHFSFHYFFNGQLFYEIIAVLPIFFYGFWLAFSYEKTKNILCPIAVHMWLNFMIF